MGRKIIFNIIVFFLIVSIISINLVSSQFGFDNPDLPRVTRDAPAVITFNNNTGSVNSSDFWDNIDTINITQMENSGGVLIKAQNGVASILYGVNSVNFGVIGTLSNHDFRIFTNNIVKFVVEAGGNVGIGDTTPDAELDIVGASSTVTDPILIVDSSGSSSVIFLTTNEIHRGTVRADVTGNIVLNAQGGNPYIRLNDGVPNSGAGTQYFCSDSTGKVTVSSSCGSSALIKKNITNLAVDTMSIINQLVPRKYQWIGNNKTSIGFIAQEMESILPEAIIYNQERDISGFNYDVVTALNVKAIQELKQENDLMRFSLCNLGEIQWC